MTKIIVLNGIGSVGKTSAAKAFQEIVKTPFMHVSGDAFLDMMPPQLWDHPEGIIFRPAGDIAGTSVSITMGARLDQLMAGMRSAVAAMAGQGNNLIVDDVMLSPSDQEDYWQKCVEHDLYFVGLHAPLAVLEQREKERGDRLIGLARWQFDKVHKGIAYDCQINTSTSLPNECARQIAEELRII